MVRICLFLLYKAHDKSGNRQQDQCAGMVESRRKASDASDAAGSQQGCSDKRTPGKDMWVRSSTEGNVLHCKNAGEPVQVPVSSHRAAWVKSTEYLPFEPLVPRSSCPLVSTD